MYSRDFCSAGGEIPAQPGQHFLREILILHRRAAKHVPQPGIRIAQKVAAAVREGVQQKHLLIGPLDFPWSLNRKTQVQPKGGLDVFRFAARSVGKKQDETPVDETPQIFRPRKRSGAFPSGGIPPPLAAP